MTNILPFYYSFIEKESKRKNKTKREIIEESVKCYIEKQKIEAIKAAYRSMAQDTEYLKELSDSAETGIEYFLNDIDNADK